MAHDVTKPRMGDKCDLFPKPEEVLYSIAAITESDDAFIEALKDHTRRGQVYWPEPIPYMQGDLEDRLVRWCMRSGYFTVGDASIPNKALKEVDEMRFKGDAQGPMVPGYMGILDGYAVLFSVYKLMLETPVVDKAALRHLYVDLKVQQMLRAQEEQRARWEADYAL